MRLVFKEPLELLRGQVLARGAQFLGIGIGRRIGMMELPLKVFSRRRRAPDDPFDNPCPHTVVLTIPGSLGEVKMIDIHTHKPYLLVDGKRTKGKMRGGFEVPMRDGTIERIVFKAFVPGYPTITWRGTTLFQHKLPTTRQALRESLTTDTPWVPPPSKFRE